MTNNTNNEFKKVETTTTTITGVKRDFILNENVTESSVKDIITGILAVNKHDDEKLKKDPNYAREPITLIVNSFGGNVYDGFALTGVIDSSDTPVHTYCYGKAMSMGFIIFASGHKRFASPFATFMYHQISSMTGGFIQDIKESIEQSESLMETYDSYILATTNVPKHLMDKTKLSKENWFITAQDAFNYNLVDEILVSKRNK